MKRKCWMLLCFLGIIFLTRMAEAENIYLTTLKAYNAIGNGCWFCDIFDTLFKIMNDITTSMCRGMKDTFLMLLGVFMLFWLAIRVGKVVLDISGKPDTAFVPDLLKQILKVIVASLLITGYVQVFHNIIGSALELSIGVGNRIMGNPATIVSSSRPSYNSPAVTTKKPLCADLYIEIEKAKNRTGPENDNAFSNVTKEAFLCYVQTGSAAMINGMAMGITGTLSWFRMGFMEKWDHFSLIWVGMIVYWMFFLLFVYFPVQLFDPLLNLMFVSSMYPLWMVMAVFQGTKGYANKAKDMFLSVLVHLIVISIVAKLAIEVMASALGTQSQRVAAEMALSRGVAAHKVFSQMENQGVWMTLALGIMAFSLMKQAPKIASNFQSGMVDMGGNSAMGSLAGSALKLSTNAAASGVSAGYHAVQGGVSRMAQRNDKWGRVGRNLQRAGDLTGAVASTGLAISTFGMYGGGAVAAWGKVFKQPQRFVGKGKDFEEATGKYTMDGKRKIYAKTDKNGNAFKYEADKGIFESQDKEGKTLGKYDQKHQEISLDGRNYKIFNNQVLTMDNKSVDNNVANRVLKFRMDAELKIKELNDKANILKNAGKI